MRYRFTKNDIIIMQNHDGSLVLSIMLDGHLVERAYMFYSKDSALKKFQSEFGLYPNDYKPAGVLCLNNFGGIAVMEIEYGIGFPPQNARAIRAASRARENAIRCHL